jgi:hypothetical protein
MARLRWTKEWSTVKFIVCSNQLRNLQIIEDSELNKGLPCDGPAFAENYLQFIDQEPLEASKALVLHPKP